ncbi:early nodulin-like protein 2 [Amphibalanus amphitrite]|uniref:early nodulin-like protein 2 n=1 Tax=Amphibalanus amphitrite TaxID=1232801 RepID=UPI001C9198AD|nr:early nodulin-like protein 2 [Amphibalanus amphitrite]
MRGGEDPAQCPPTATSPNSPAPSRQHGATGEQLTSAVRPGGGAPLSSSPRGPSATPPLPATASAVASRGRLRSVAAPPFQPSAQLPGPRGVQELRQYGRLRSVAAPPLQPSARLPGSRGAQEPRRDDNARGRTGAAALIRPSGRAIRQPSRPAPGSTAGGGARPVSPRAGQQPAAAPLETAAPMAAAVQCVTAAGPVDLTAPPALHGLGYSRTTCRQPPDPAN